jgi:hypothetical protein
VQHDALLSRRLVTSRWPGNRAGFPWRAGRPCFVTCSSASSTSRRRERRGRKPSPASAARGRATHADAPAERTLPQLGRWPQPDELDQLRPRCEQRGRVGAALVPEGEMATHFTIQGLDQGSEAVGFRHDPPGRTPVKRAVQRRGLDYSRGWADDRAGRHESPRPLHTYSLVGAAAREVAGNFGVRARRRHRDPGALRQRVPERPRSRGNFWIRATSGTRRPPPSRPR